MDDEKLRAAWRLSADIKVITERIELLRKGWLVNSWMPYAADAKIDEAWLRPKLERFNREIEDHLMAKLQALKAEYEGL